MRSFAGSYHGVSPTDESAIASGEFSMKIGAKFVAFRHAVRPGVVWEGSILLSDVRKMSVQEVFPYGVPEGASGKHVGFATSGGVQFIFTLDPSRDEFDVLIRRGSMYDLLGPTVLWSRRRLGHVLLLKMRLFLLNHKFKGNVPRLSRWRWSPL